MTPPAAPQPAAPVVIVPPTIAPVTQAAPTFSPTAPMVQATPTVEESKAAAIAASQAEAPARPQRAEPRVAERAAAPVARTPAAERPSAPAPIRAPVTQAAPPTPVPAPAAEIAPAAPVAVAEPAVTPAVAQGADPSLYWALSGAALVLLGIGGTAMMRRRREDELAEPVMMDAPATIEPRPVAPVMTPAPVLARTPEPVRAPAYAAGDEHHSLAAMVAAAPSRDNPFLTHAKRMRRAKFLLAQRDVTLVEAPVTAPAAPAPVDRSQTVYSFGPASGRAGFLKPRTT